MSMPAKTEKPGAPALDDAMEPAPVSLETALERIDAIVREMEAGDLPLETLIGRYEEGIALSKLCREKLDRAEERIRILSHDTGGNPVLEEFDTNTDE
jgi:exodeoxyribonuclease VII small subunit